ncbi:hypothetical protein BDY17DRAFT_53780 [Neohortaea acidophila]|uniref:Zn(2)-C6 fungal-type domain-containing protein n=1 Tax=Neohortaea acidophila TaxID=245834 RepID=A0A6A6PHN6_9PEZI|nr:uncharacterized protein BDY17DRAFT_53780 [Neohortaea acidophila]KAF2479296.1 hypothetical protein BDY17DRAFT_53780 [Neohortaea acidophila]
MTTKSSLTIPTAQLSCEQCQQRKTKCSKTVPCAACVKAGISCTAVQRHRLPRGRSRAQRRGTSTVHALTDRIARLEAVVAQYQQNGSSDHDASNQPQSHPERQVGSAIKPIESFIASDFWVELSDAVAGLRHVLEDDVDGELGGEGDSTPASATISPDASSLLLGTGPHIARLNEGPGPETRDWLMAVYKERVDVIFKPLHWPTVLLQILSVKGQRSLEIEALESAILFTAACSLFKHELRGTDVSVEYLLQRVEAALVEVGLLTTTSILVLQAFVIYLAGLRVIRAKAQQWTLTAVAIRLANAQGIPHRLKPAFDGEIQRRLWFCIGVLDLQCSFDRGSQPLLRSDDFPSWPLNINDHELSPEHAPSPSRPLDAQYTEMSLSSIIYRAGICQRRLTEIGLSAASSNVTVDPIIVHRQQHSVLSEFEHSVLQLSSLLDHSGSSIQKFTLAVANESLVAMRLLIRRPLYRSGNGSNPHGANVDGDFDLLSTATSVLESSQMKRTQIEFAPWAWFSWVKWYALAIVLAELCTARGPEADRAWEVAQKSFDDYAEAAAMETNRKVNAQGENHTREAWSNGI